MKGLIQSENHKQALEQAQLETMLREDQKRLSEPLLFGPAFCSQ